VRKRQGAGPDRLAARVRGAAPGRRPRPRHSKIVARVAFLSRNQGLARKQRRTRLTHTRRASHPPTTTMSDKCVGLRDRRGGGRVAAAAAAFPPHWAATRTFVRRPAPVGPRPHAIPTPRAAGGLVIRSGLPASNLRASHTPPSPSHAHTRTPTHNSDGRGSAFFLSASEGDGGRARVRGAATWPGA
jgi:hypothetical protein